MTNLSSQYNHVQAQVQTKPVYKRILVVEDDLELTGILEHVFSAIDPNIHTDWVTSAEEAVSLLEDKTRAGEQRPYDLIIADIFLEGSSTGLDLWKLCQEYFSDVPFVVTSALPVDKFFKALGTETISPPFLPKPFLPGECRQLIEGVLNYATT